MKKSFLYLLIALCISRVSVAQVVNTEGFESGVFPPVGWTAVTATNWWSTVTSQTTGYPAVTVYPHSGSYEGFYNSYTASSGVDQTICSPSFSRAAVGSAIDSISFWMYRDNGYSSYADETISVYISTTPDFTGSSIVGTVARSTSVATPVTVSGDGWYYYSFPVPSGYTGSINYILLQANSEFGNNMFVDDISWTSWPPACGGMPVAGTITGPASVCPSTSFNLSLTGDSVASGLNYQWYSSPSGAGTFSAIAGATNNFYTASSLSAATDYKLLVTCTAGSLTDSTPVFTVNITPYYACYCNSDLGGDTYGEAPIDSVSIAGTTLNNYTPGSTSLYTLFPDSGSTTCTLQQGLTYNIFINSSGYDYYNAYMWIDYDHSGTYDPGEYTQITSYTAPGVSTTGFTVSTTSDTGLTGMRIRTCYEYDYIGSGDACTNEYSGQTQDYIIDIIPAIPCTGTPSAGTASATNTLICSGAPFNLSDAGSSIGGGLTGQWYSSPSGAGTWSALYGGGSTVITGETQTVATDYIYVNSCSFSDSTDTSNVVTVNMAPFYLCYCSPLTGVTLDNYAGYSPIDSFAISGTTLNNYTPTASGLYQQFYPVTPTTTGTVVQGSTYTAYVNSNGGGFDNYNAAVWIDYDHSGTFDASEYYMMANDAPYNIATSASITIPGTADTGITGLRVRVTPYFYSFGSGDACTDEYYGSVNDYVINIAPGVPCSGAPDSGIAFSNYSTVCPAQSFSLNDTGAANGLGITYTWYSSPAGAGTYTPLYGGTSLLVTGNTQTAATDYILVVTCSNSGISDTSNVVSVGMSPFYLCYCSPQIGVTLDNDASYSPIDSVAIAGTTLNNSTPGGTGVYIQYWPVTSSTTATLSQGSTYTMAVNSDGGLYGDNYNAEVWIDYDHSGTFDYYESILNANNVTYDVATSQTFWVDTTTDTGITGLRVRIVPYYYYIGTSDACTNEYDGAVQDYIINIIPGVPCSGTPAAGIAYGSLTSVCDGASFNLSDSGYSNGLGLTYQWYSSPSGAGTFTPLYGGTTALVTGVTQVGATDYILVVTCTNSDSTDTSNVITIGSNPFYLCYCSPQTGITLDNSADYSPINDVAISGTTLNNPTPLGSGLYTEYWPVTPSTTGTLAQAAYFTISVNSNGGIYDENYSAGAWIDYDHSGTFDASEYILNASNVNYGTNATNTFLVPETADTGMTGLRVRVTPYYYSFGSGDACTNEYDGAVADYVININPGTPCSGTPVAGTAMAPTTVCSNSLLNLSDTGFSVAVGISYQWYSSPTGAGTFTALAGATSNTYSYNQDSATDYYFVATCTVSGHADTSNTITVVETPFSGCYCNDGNLDTDPEYTSLDSVNIYGTSLSVYSASSSPYIQFAPTGSNTDTLIQSSTYTIGVYVTNSSFFGDSYDAAAWIDYDHSGVFDPSEYIPIVTNASNGTSSSASFTVPLTADTGTTGLRVRAIASYFTMGSGDACTDYYEGQTYDFQIYINPAPACAGIPTAGIASASAGSACDSTTITLTDLSAATSTGLTFQWESSADEVTWVDMAGATTDPYSFSGMLTTTYFRLIVTCTNSGLTDTSNIFVINSTPCYCTNPLWAFGTDPTSDAMSVFTATGGFGGTSINDATIIADADPTTGYADHTGLPIMEMQQGGSYPVTATFNEYSMEYETQVWIDFGDDGTFDPTDTVTPVFGFSTYDAGSGSGTITIPATAPFGAHRMRVRNAWLEWSSYSGTVSDPMDPCAESDAEVTYGTGDVVDYTIYIVPNACDSVITITDTGITSSTATVIWDSVGGAAGYEYTVSTIAGVPTGAGTPTTDTFANLTGLVSGTTYYVYVRSSCGPGYYSGWSIVNTFTTNCDTVTALTVSAITGTSATITWDSVAGSATYDYQVDGSPSAPGGSGISTTVTTENLTGLLPGSTYYAHVRNSCPGGGFSSWVTVPFTTPCDTVTGLSVSGVTDTSALINWTAVSGSSDYQYVLDNSSTAPAGSGITTSALTLDTTSLTPGTTYYIHVRNQCAGGGYSSWVTVPFTTGFCDSIAPASVFVAASDTGVIFSFPGVSGSLGYYYTVNTTPVSPTSGGTFSTATSDTVNGLTPGNSYYIHIRTGCGGGYSTWTTIPFTTGICDSVVGLTITSSDTGLVFSFTPTVGALGYYYTVSTTPGVPAGLGTYTTSSPDTITGLTPGTTYYVYILSGCGGGYSTWTSGTTATHPCDTVTGLTVYANDTAALVTWTAVTGVGGYLYVIDSSSSSPAVSGTFTTGTSDTITSGLVPGTTYYAHVRVDCGGGDTSAWVTVPFTLSPCDTTAAIVLDSTTSSVTIGWVYQAGAGYYYVLDTSPTPPSSTSGATYAIASDTTATFTSLTSGGVYYFHIEVVCNYGSGESSSWITIEVGVPSLGVGNVNNANFSVEAFPNPAINTVTVKVSGNKGANRVVELSDVTGKIISTVEMPSNQVDVDVSNVAAGIYLIKYVDDEHTQVIKINKQ